MTKSGGDTIEKAFTNTQTLDVFGLLFLRERHTHTHTGENTHKRKHNTRTHSSKN